MQGAARPETVARAIMDWKRVREEQEQESNEKSKNHYNRLQLLTPRVKNTTSAKDDKREISHEWLSTTKHNALMLHLKHFAHLHTDKENTNTTTTPTKKHQPKYANLHAQLAFAAKSKTQNNEQTSSNKSAPEESETIGVTLGEVALAEPCNFSRGVETESYPPQQEHNIHLSPNTDIHGSSSTLPLHQTTATTHQPPPMETSDLHTLRKSASRNSSHSRTAPQELPGREHHSETVSGVAGQPRGSLLPLRRPKGPDSPSQQGERPRNTNRGLRSEEAIARRQEQRSFKRWAARRAHRKNHNRENPWPSEAQ